MMKLGVAFCVTGCLVAGVCGAAPEQEKNPAEYNAAGIAHYDAGEWDKAIADFEQAYELVPDNRTVRRNLCNAHQNAANQLAKGADFKEAAKHLELAISVDPENANPLIQLGFYYLRLDMVPDAIFRMEEAISLNMESVDAHELLGDAYYKDNDLPSALVQWQWVAAVEPARPNVREKIDKAKREQSVEQTFRRTESRHFRVSAPPDAPSASLAQVLTILEGAYLEVGRNFADTFPSGPIQVIIYNRAGFADVTQLVEHVGGLYDGKIRIPLLDMDGAVLPDDELERRLKHEYTHVVVRFLAADHVPWWLNEGLAETFSREFVPPVTTLLQKGYDDGTVFPLKDLEGTQLQKLDANQLQIAYCQSHGTAKLLYDRFRQHPLRAFMSSLAEGMAYEEAIRINFRYTYPQLESEVAESVGRQYGE